MGAELHTPLPEEARPKDFGQADRQIFRSAREIRRMVWKVYRSEKCIRHVYEMPRILKKRQRFSDDIVGWAGLLIAAVALIVLDRPSEPHKWHPAIVWSCTAFSGIALFGRTHWRSWRFWVLWTLFLLLHVFLMWWIFDKVLPPGHVWGTIYVMPLGFVEAILLVGLIVRIEHIFDPHPKERHAAHGDEV